MSVAAQPSSSSKYQEAHPRAQAMVPRDTF